MAQIYKTKRLILISILSAMGFILMFLKFPLPFLPPYLTIDFSDLPALVALFTVGPLGAILVEFIKNLLNFITSPADPIGPVANFIAGAAFLMTVYVVMKHKNNKVISLTLGVIVMTIMMSLMNYFVLLPMYGMIMNLSDVVTNVKVIVAAGIVPFNLIKGALLGGLFLIVEKTILPSLQSQFSVK